jgi:uncharacterized protein YkwD
VDTPEGLARLVARLEGEPRIALDTEADSFHHSSQLAAGTGEILAWGTCAWFTPLRAVRMWLNSSSHRALLLRPSFRYVGTGWTRGNWRGYNCVEMAVARFR